MRLVHDIETVPIGECPEAPEEHLSKGMGNASRPDTIERKREENRATWPATWAKTSALDWRRGQIILISLVIGPQDDAPIILSTQHATEDEILRTFWEKVATTKGPLVGFNSRRFDFPYLVGRSAVYGITPTRRITESPYTHHQMIDYLDVLSSHSAFTTTGWDLGSYCRLFNIPEPRGKGSDVYEQYQAGDWASIVEHGRSDVVATAQLDTKLRPIFLGGA